MIRRQNVRLPADVLIIAILAGTLWLLYGQVTQLWWTYDDAYLLHLTSEHRVADFFFKPMPHALSTPLVTTGYKVQPRLFGLDPSRWFVFHLLSAVAAMAAVYGAARIYLGHAGAATAAALIFAGVPVCSLMTRLSTEHYFLALFFGALAAGMFAAALRRRNIALAVASALLYLVAMLAKEVMVPLIGFLFLLPESDTRTRTRFLTGHAVALGLYLIWRRMIIGTILGGYGWAIAPDEWIEVLAKLPGKMVMQMSGANLPLGVLLLALMAMPILAAAHRRRALILFGATLALAIAPIAPVSKGMERRYALMAWICCAFAFAAAIEGWRRRGGALGKCRLGLLLLVPLLALCLNRQEWDYEFGRTKRMSAEARFFVDMPPNGLLRGVVVPPAAMRELDWLKTRYGRKPGGARWFNDDLYLCDLLLTGKQAWEFETERQEVIEITPELQQIRDAHCTAVRNEAPLSTEFHYRNGALFWKLGPYSDGTWRFVFALGAEGVDVPSDGGFRLSAVQKISLRVRYTSPAGWTTYSPEMAFDFVQDSDWKWHRMDRDAK